MEPSANDHFRDQGTAAAAAQSVLQPIVPHGAFAALQSAGAGGYGVPIVHGVVQGAAAVLAGALGYAAARDDDGASTEEENGQKTRREGNRKAKEVDEQKPQRTVKGLTMLKFGPKVALRNNFPGVASILWVRE